MSSRLNLTLVAAGALAVAALSLPAFAGASRDRSIATSEFSAQSKEDPKKKKVAPKTVAPAKKGPVHVAPRVIQRQVAPAGSGQKKFESQKKAAPKVATPPVGAPRIVRPHTGGPQPARRVFTPRGNNARVVTAARIRSAPARGAFRTSIRGRNYSVWRSGYRVRRGNSWRTFVALGALGVLAIGAAEYYPYAYIDAPPEYCDGLTEDGCQLVFDEVETMEGDLIGQCVAYCPWR